MGDKHDFFVGHLGRGKGTSIIIPTHTIEVGIVNEEKVCKGCTHEDNFDEE